MHRSYDLYVGLQIKFISLDSTWALRGYAAIPGEESFKPDSDIGTILSKLVEKRIWMRASPVKGKRASSVFMRLSLRTYAGGAGVLEAYVDGLFEPLALAVLSAKRLDSACCVHGYWTDALDWSGTAGFLLQGPGELMHELLICGLDRAYTS
eukprot:1061519-Pelagomonas_calceolata.AAC.12